MRRRQIHDLLQEASGCIEQDLLVAARAVLEKALQLEPSHTDALALLEEARVHLAAVLLDSVDHEPPDTGKPVSWEKAEALIFDPPDGPKAR